MTVENRVTLLHRFRNISVAQADKFSGFLHRVSYVVTILALDYGEATTKSEHDMMIPVPLDELTV